MLPIGAALKANAWMGASLVNGHAVDTRVPMLPSDRRLMPTVTQPGRPCLLRSGFLKFGYGF